MGSKQAKYVNDSDANDASMLKDMPVVFYVRMPLAFATRSYKARMTKSMGGSNPGLLSITVKRNGGEHMFACSVYCEL